MANGWLATVVFHDPNAHTPVEYWVRHSADRARMRDWCQHKPQKQDSSDCQVATAAQLKVDTGAASHPNQTTQTNGVDQATGQASDQLNAQQDSNALDPGGR